MDEITLGISPCPNDTFIFFHLLNKKRLPFKIRPVVADVERLNELVLKKELDISKVSFALAGRVLDNYIILNSGAALGRGCGPLLLGKEPVQNIEELENKQIGIPGKYTTATLLFQMFLPRAKNLQEMLFSKIPGAIAKGEIFAGCCIHETRFTYKNFGLTQIADLGKWWEEKTRLPIPLGGIVAQRSISKNRLLLIQEAIKESIEYAEKNPEETLPFIKRYAQEMEVSVLKKHIDLYVNDFSKSLRDEGQDAIKALFEIAQGENLLPKTYFNDIFLSS